MQAARFGLKVKRLRRKPFHRRMNLSFLQTNEATPAGQDSTVLCTIIGLLTCAALALNLRAQQSQQAPQSQTKQQGVIRVQTNLVSILASVIDANGQPIPDLKQDVFQLSEEGVPQKIERFEAADQSSA